MRNLRTGALCVFFFSLSFAGFAQHAPLPITEPDYNKPKLFAALPQTLSLMPEALQSLLQAVEGERVSFVLGGATYKGTVVSLSDKADTNVRSVVIRSSNYPGSAFTVTEIKDGDRMVYRGRIISRDHSDAYELQVMNGQYRLVKKHQLNIMNE
jgi:hypothetical protein